MIVTNLHIANFRNHGATTVVFSPGVNILVGLNGSGKTNLLDALHVLFMSRSFVTTSDQNLVKQGEESFEIDAELEGSIRAHFQLTCSYRKADGKKFYVNKSPIEKLTDLIGMVPVVVLSPDDRRLTKEGPAERRSFLDSMISQTSKSYLLQLVEYRRVLKQRNRLLSEFRGELEGLEPLIAPWDAQLAHYGAAITLERENVLQRFQTLLADVYFRLGLGELNPSLIYRAEESDTDLRVEERLHPKAQLEASILAKLENKLFTDWERGNTSAGPHRDDLVFLLDGKDLRRFGSQGQHRLFAIALKLAQLQWFSEVLNEAPVLILDDIFGELDTQKTRSIAGFLSENRFQTFISVAKEGLILPHLESVEQKSVFTVSNGQIVA